MPIAAGAQPAAVWTPARVERLRYWLAAAPEDGLPAPDTGALDKAVQAGDPAATDIAANVLALCLARLHLLGFASPAERSGWNIADGDDTADLPARLDKALRSDALDAFYAGLAPHHPDYAALRTALAKETIPLRRKTIALNMERWRWMPQDPGRDFVLVNAAAFEVSLWRKGQRAGVWPVIVGKKSTPTPVFSATISGVTVNPWWDVPASIVRERHGRFPAGLGYVRSGGNWRQRPGPANSLGQIKLVMPNPYNVYLHDTPSKDLFARDVRAFSHGCVRVGGVVDFAASLFDGAKSREELAGLVASGRTATLDLPARLPVHIAYFTAGSRGDGTFGIWPDIYGRDTKFPAGTGGKRDGCSG